MAKKENKNHITVLDIGASKIVCLVVETDYLNNTKIIGIGHQIAKGIGMDGVISDIKSLEGSIISAISAAEKSANIDIENVYVNFSGNKLRSRYNTIEIDITGGEVTDKDVSRINEMAFELFSDDNQEVIQCIPMTYSIDGIMGIHNPRFMYGKKLIAYLNVVTISTSALQNLLNCLARCHLNVNGILPSGYAAALSSVSYEELQNGVTLIDIGESNSSIAIFVEGKMYYTISFPFGGKLLTRDIQQIFSLTQSAAERVKSLYGSVFYEEINSRDDIDLFDIINTEDSCSTNYIQKHKLCEIIYERIKEILNYINNHLNTDTLASKAYQRAFGNIVLTGGSANLLGISELAKNIFGVRVKIAKPEMLEHMPAEHNDARFSTAYGLIMHALKHTQNNSVEFKDFSHKGIVLEKIREISRYNQLSDFLRKYF